MANSAKKSSSTSTDTVEVKTTPPSLLNGASEPAQPRVSTGVTGLDEILYGGVIPQRAYLVRGGPGCGKTTLGLHFLTDGAAKGEESLFITLGEPEAELRANAAKLGFDLTHVHVLDLSPSAAFFTQMQTYDIFSPAEVEREPVT